jgi:hypothetical protein
MRKSSLPAILVGLLVLGALATAVLTVSYVTAVGSLRKLQPQVAQMTQQQAVIRSLIGETLDYSKTHPDMQALIKSIDAKAATGAAPSPSTPQTSPN